MQTVSNAMTVKRFKKILQALHVNDNKKATKWGDTRYDKRYKLRALIEKLNKKFQGHCVETTSQSIDESTGYVFQVKIYVGKQNDDHVEVGLSGRVVKRLCQQLKSNKYTSYLTTFSHHPA